MSKHKVRMVIHVTPQTAYHLKRMADMEGCNVGRVVDKLVRDRAMLMKGACRNGKET